ncbi:DUF4190 domain-containing protein [Spirillospora sp. NPDC048911]|uniref:DUF4190 domain-containing protein n=1 Tax=Spirillospora sp. NPDC048911 TaxID=3364527 RepID=UPI003710C31C
MAQPPYDPYGYASQDPYAQQQYPPAQVQHHYYGSAPVAVRTNGMATAAMILGIIGIFTCGFGSILAVIFGHVAQGQIRRTGEGGSGMAVAGLIMGYIMLALGLLYWIVVVGLYGAAWWTINESGSGSTY